jgi:hypothetical protein
MSPNPVEWPFRGGAHICRSGVPLVAETNPHGKRRKTWRLEDCSSGHRSSFFWLLSTLSRLRPAIITVGHAYFSSRRLKTELPSYVPRRTRNGFSIFFLIRTISPRNDFLSSSLTVPDRGVYLLRVEPFGVVSSFILMGEGGGSAIDA